MDVSTGSASSKKQHRISPGTCLSHRAYSRTKLRAPRTPQSKETLPKPDCGGPRSSLPWGRCRNTHVRSESIKNCNWAGKPSGTPSKKGSVDALSTATVADMKRRQYQVSAYELHQISQHFRGEPRKPVLTRATDQRLYQALESGLQERQHSTGSASSKICAEPPPEHAFHTEPTTVQSHAAHPRELKRNSKGGLQASVPPVCPTLRSILEQRLAPGWRCSGRRGVRCGTDTLTDR